MKLLILSMLALVCASEPATASSAARGAPYVMPRSEVRDMVSRTGDAYRIYIAWPEATPPSGGYPILYLLDGDASFGVTAEAANRFGPYWGLEPGIIVAIGYPSGSRRTWDYTPVSDAPPDLPDATEGGGADAFLAFLADTLIPSVEADYRVDRTRRTLMGYSLGGLFTLHALFHRPELFANYVAASPSIWYSGKAELAALPAFETRMRRGDLRVKLAITAGQYEQSPAPGMAKDPAWLKIAALSRKAAMIDNGRALAERLKPLPGLTTSFAVIAGETHATGNFPALRDSLRAAFGRRK